MRSNEQSLIELANSLSLYQKTEQIAKFPHAEELQNNHIVYLSKTHYVFVKKSPPHLIMLECHEIVYDEANHDYIVVENSFFSLAKCVSREEMVNNFPQHVIRTNAQIGISTMHKPIILNGKPHIFMKKIDTGKTLEDAFHEENKSIRELILCVKKAMQDALYLRNTALILHLDIKADNIMFPSGHCIDLEFCAYLPSHTSQFAVFAKELKITPDKIEDFREDLDLPTHLFALDKSGEKVVINISSMEFSFGTTLIQLSEQLFNSRNLLPVENSILKDLRNLGYLLEKQRIILEEAIAKLDEALERFNYPFKASAAFFKSPSSHHIDVEINQFLKKLESGLADKERDELLDLRQKAHELREKLRYHLNESKEFKSLKSSSFSNAKLVIQQQHIEFLSDLIDNKINPKLEQNAYIPPLAPLY